MARIVLPANLDISCEDFVRDAREASACADVVTLDGGAVSRVDAAGLQLVYALVASGQRRGITVTWESASRALADAATITGLASSLGLEGKA